MQSIFSHKDVQSPSFNAFEIVQGNESPEKSPQKTNHANVPNNNNIEQATQPLTELKKEKENNSTQ